MAHCDRDDATATRDRDITCGDTRSCRQCQGLRLDLSFVIVIMDDAVTGAFAGGAAEGIVGHDNPRQIHGPDCQQQKQRQDERELNKVLPQITGEPSIRLAFEYL